MTFPLPITYIETPHFVLRPSVPARDGYVGPVRVNTAKAQRALAMSYLPYSKTLYQSSSHLHLLEFPSKYLRSNRGTIYPLAIDDITTAPYLRDPFGTATIHDYVHACRTCSGLGSGQYNSLCTFAGVGFVSFSSGNAWWALGYSCLRRRAVALNSKHGGA